MPLCVDEPIDQGDRQVGRGALAAQLVSRAFGWDRAGFTGCPPPWGVRHLAAGRRRLGDLGGRGPEVSWVELGGLAAQDLADGGATLCGSVDLLGVVLYVEQLGECVQLVRSVAHAEATCA